jgi:hypothetical protein
MIASALVFAGSIMWWKKLAGAFTFITSGAILFMLKNVLDLINETWKFGITNETVTMREIDSLAMSLGGEFFPISLLGVYLFLLP